MCGITAFWAIESVPDSSIIDKLFEYGEKRGSDAVGFATYSCKPYRKYLDRKIIGCGNRKNDSELIISHMRIGDILIANHRAAPETEMGVKDERSIQPITYPYDEIYKLSLSHNGSVSGRNVTEFGLSSKYQRFTDLDSEAINFAYLTKGRDMKRTMEYLSGGFSFIMLDGFKNKLYAVCTHNPLYCGYMRGLGMFFSSFREAIYEVISMSKGIKIERQNISVWEDYYVREIPENTIVEFDVDSKLINEIKFTPRYIHPKYDPYKDKRETKEKVLVSASGGLDSTTTLATLQASGYDVTAIHFKYGHRGGKAEELAINSICKILKIPVITFDIVGNMRLLDSNSMLTNSEHEITTGTDHDLKTTIAWTCFRNGLFISYMGALAESLIINEEYTKVYITGGFMNLTESGCIIDCEDNKILMYDNRQILPSEVNVGDRLLSFNFDNRKLESTTVKKIFSPIIKNRYILKLKYESGPVKGTKILEVSGEHPFYIKNKGWIPTDRIDIGDILYSYKECEMSTRAKDKKFIAKKTVLRGDKHWLYGKHHSEETKKKISEVKKGKPVHSEKYKNILREKMRGSRNPMYGHIRSNSIECWCGKIHTIGSIDNRRTKSKNNWNDNKYRHRVDDGVSKYWKSEDGIKRKKELKCKMRDVALKRIEDNNGIHWNQTVEGREKCRQATLKMIKEGKINPSNLFAKSPNKCEKFLIDLFNKHNIPFRFVGDGQIWITSEGKHMNPDFINVDSKSIIEYYGGLGFFHTEDEIVDRNNKYEKVGWRHLAITENDIKDIDKLLEKVYNFVYEVHNGWIVEKIEKIVGQYHMLNFHCEPINNFFVNKILTHNSYPDNSERFINAFSKFARFASIVGTKIEPLYCCANLLKCEQYILLDKLRLLDKIGSWLISCDRPIYSYDGTNDEATVANCSKNGKPACGSGLLSSWAAQLAGIEDPREYYEVKDDEYIPHEHKEDLKPKYINIFDVVEKLLIPEGRKSLLLVYLETACGFL